MQERRLFPRYFFAAPLQVRGASGAAFEALTTEISLGGIGFVLQRPAVVALAQGGAILTIGDCLHASLDAAPAGGAGLRLPGCVRSVRRLSHDEYLVALAFEEISPSQREMLAALVGHARTLHLKS